MKKIHTIITSLLISSVVLSQNNDVTDCNINCPENLIEIAALGENSKNVDYTITFDCESETICEIVYDNFTIENQGNNNHAINTNWNDISWIVANDFDVPEGETVEISNFIPTLINYATNADIYFYENNNGVPGELITSFLDVATDDINLIGNTQYDNPVYEATYLLPNTVELTSGKYWIAMHADYLNPPNAYVSVYWANSENIIEDGGHHAYKSSDGGLTWNTSGVMQLADGAFRLGYLCDNEIELIKTEGLASGEAFPIGETQVTYELKEGDTVLDTCTFSVTVNETPILCSIECPEDINVQTDEDFAVVSYEVLTTCETEGIETELVMVEGFTSGSEFPVGETIVTYNLAYNDEIIDTCSFAVIVDKNVSTDDFSANELLIFPNPVLDIININSSQNISSIQIYSISGAPIKTIEVNNNVAQLDLNDLNSGIYFLKNNTEGNTKIYKIIKK